MKVLQEHVLDYTYCEVINCIEDLDSVLHNCKNGDFDIRWCNAVDMSLVQVKNEFLCEEIRNTDVIHDEDFDPTMENKFLNDNDIKISNISFKNNDKIRLYNE